MVQNKPAVRKITRVVIPEGLVAKLEVKGRELGLTNLTTVLTVVLTNYFAGLSSGKVVVDAPARAGTVINRPSYGLRKAIVRVRDNKQFDVSQQERDDAATLFVDMSEAEGFAWDQDAAIAWLKANPMTKKEEADWADLIAATKAAYAAKAKPVDANTIVRNGEDN